MAMYRLSVKVGQHGASRSHFDYITRDGKYKRHDNQVKEDLVYHASYNLPSWAKQPRDFWKQEEIYKDGFRKIELSVPPEGSLQDQIELVESYCRAEFGDEYTYSFAIHHSIGALSGKENPHAHIMFCERKIDHNRVEPKREDYFKKSRTRKDGSISGGYKKDRKFKGFDDAKGSKWIDKTREDWGKMLREYYLVRGQISLAYKVSHKSLKDQGVDRDPQKHLGYKVVGMYKRGIVSEHMEEYFIAKAQKDYEELGIEEYYATLDIENPNMLEEIRYDVENIDVLNTELSSLEEQEKLILAAIQQIEEKEAQAKIEREEQERLAKEQAEAELKARAEKELEEALLAPYREEEKRIAHYEEKRAVIQVELDEVRQEIREIQGRYNQGIYKLDDQLRMRVLDPKEREIVTRLRSLRDAEDIRRSEHKSQERKRLEAECKPSTVFEKAVYLRGQIALLPYEKDACEMVIQIGKPYLFSDKNLKAMIESHQNKQFPLKEVEQWKQEVQREIRWDKKFKHIIKQQDKSMSL